MDSNPILYQISLKLIPGIGDVLIRNLISYCGGPEQVFKQSKARLEKIPGIGSHLADNIRSFKDFDRAAKEIEFIDKHQIKPVFYLDKNYPVRLKEIADAPTLLYVLGNVELNPPKTVGIVGTRKASEYGKAFTQNLVHDLKELNCVVLSGLAFGIDVIAHKAAIDEELPTVGVLAHGLDRIYPSQHKTVARKMLENGGLLTEFPSLTNPDRENFPKRNRIVAGMCDVLVVVETAIKGGARITAEIANSYNKDIMAVPGRINDYYSEGCNYLIKENKAAMITSSQDLFNLMGWGKKPAKQQKSVNLFSQLSEADAQLLLFIQQKQKTGVDDMAFELNIDPGVLALKLLELEFEGYIRTLPGRYYELI
ncbi:MAG: DNA-protecting protein DprA [Bacteroidia bacterium]|nr:DNA-protecting protein DprA [Bacteroidia bacterium]